MVGTSCSPLVILRYPWILPEVRDRREMLCSQRYVWIGKLEFWIEKSCVTLVQRPLCDRRSHAEIMRALVVLLWRWTSQ